MKRALVTALTCLVATAPLSVAATQPRSALVVFVHAASLPDLLSVPAARRLAASGGAAVMNGRTGARQAVAELAEDHRPPPDQLAMTEVSGADQLATLLDEVHVALRDPTLVMVVSVSPSAASAAVGDELGSVIAAWGDPDAILSASGQPRALTSDSTRRAGVVADVDPAATIAEWLDLPHDAGAPITATDEPVPLDLYDRYLQYRRLAVPAAAASWILLGAAAIAAIAIVRTRDRVSDRALTMAAVLAAAFPWLPLALFLAGHLPSLTPWTAAPFVAGVVVAGTVFTTWVERRSGALAAVAATGAAILVILLLEALTGWGAAVTPLVGGGQLDGGRFFGMPNAMIGLVLGAAMYLAQRLELGSGAVVLGACALVGGSPWTGSDYGAAMTFSAAVGLWLGVRGGRRWWVTALLTVATTAVGTVAISLMHRYLTDRATHVTTFLEQTSGPFGAFERFVDRLGIGLDLIGDSPLAIVPVVGTIVLLALVFRPPASMAATFSASGAWRDALLVLLIGSIVAYVANDTGAAALGFGFVLALAGALSVSVAAAREKMER